MKNIAYPIRINRYLALRNISSRREADEIIKKGLVKINGRIAKLGDKVNECDTVEVDRKKYIKRNLYFAYYKPYGIVTHTPEEGQKSIREVGNFPEGVFPLGRLDRNSHGLIILTNDGRITDKLLNPEYGHEREYLVKINKKVNNFFLKHMQQGIELEDFRTKPCKIERAGADVFRIVLTEGKKHQIRRMCAALDCEVVDLKRTRIMNIRLANMKPSEKKMIEGKELKIFLKGLGII